MDVMDKGRTLTKKNDAVLRTYDTPSTYFIYFARKHMIKNTQVAQFANSSGSFSELYVSIS